MRSADVATLLRMPLLLATAYAIFAKANAVLVVALLAVLFLSDAADGYLATLGKHSFTDYVRYLLRKATGSKKGEKKFPRKMPAHAAYIDLAADRIIEYVLWLLFTQLQLLPWFIIAIIFVRNTIADFLVIRKKKTFSKMHSAFGKIASSHLSRGVYGALKAINFAYLSLVVVAGWPISIGYSLTLLVVAFSLLRGAAEIYESLL